MRDLANESKNRTNKKLAEKEANLVDSTRFDWGSIRPKLSDDKEMQVLKDAVAKATEHNENIGQLHKRLKKLGSKGISIADKLGDLL